MKSTYTLSLPVLLISTVFSAHALETTAEDALGVPAKVVNPEVSKSSPKYSPSIPSDAVKKPKDVVYTKEYLMAHTDELEQMLLHLLHAGNAEGLKLLLPIYLEVPKADPSVFDWGRAVIAMNDKQFKKAVKNYRKLIAKLPNNKTVRYQLSLALMANGELVAAKDQFEKLRASTQNPKDVALIDGYIQHINSRDKWDFSGSLTYAYNKNVNSAAPVGTSVRLANGGVFTNKTKPKKAHGISYSLGMDKKWSLSGVTYLGLHGSLNGTHYTDERNYNDLTARLGLGYGLRTPRGGIEAIPFVQKRWYGFGENGNGHLKSYAQIAGLRVEGNYWLNPSWRYQSAFEWAKDDYVKTHNYLDGHTVMLSNTLLYARNQNQYFYGGIDFNHKKSRLKENTYNRLGLRVGWQQAWNTGLSTSLGLGYGKRFVKGADYTGKKRRDKEFSLNASVWHRALHFKGITPRLTFYYNKTDSNNPFYEYDNKQVFVEFSKTF